MQMGGVCQRHCITCSRCCACSVHATHSLNLCTTIRLCPVPIAQSPKVIDKCGRGEPTPPHPPPPPSREPKLVLVVYNSDGKNSLIILCYRTSRRGAVGFRRPGVVVCMNAMWRSVRLAVRARLSTPPPVPASCPSLAWQPRCAPPRAHPPPLAAAQPPSCRSRRRWHASACRMNPRAGEARRPAMAVAMTSAHGRLEDSAAAPVARPRVCRRDPQPARPAAPAASCA